MELQAAEGALAALRRQNQALALRNAVMEKTLAVRDAFLAVLEHSNEMEPGRAAALAERAATLASARQRLLPHDDVEGGDGDEDAEVLAAAAPMQSAGPGACSSSGDGSGDISAGGGSCAGGGSGAGSSSSTPALPSAATAGRGLERSALAGVASVPPPSNAAVAAQLQAMAVPEEIVPLWRAWQADLCAAWAAAQAARFDQDSERRLAAVYQRMQELWWHGTSFSCPFSCFPPASKRAAAARLRCTVPRPAHRSSPLAAAPLRAERRGHEALGCSHPAAAAAHYKPACLVAIAREGMPLDSAQLPVRRPAGRARGQGQGQGCASYHLRRLSSLCPPPPGYLQVWSAIAERLVGELAPAQLTPLRRAWQQYSRRLSKCAIGCVKWVRRLQALGVGDAAELASFRTAMGDSVGLAEVGRRAGAGQGGPARGGQGGQAAGAGRVLTAPAAVAVPL